METKQDTKNVHNQAIQSIVNYISNHLFEDFDIITLCQKCGMSEYHFRRVFKFIVGENIGNYIQRLRLEYAAHLLTSTEYTLSRIAELAGYQTNTVLQKHSRSILEFQHPYLKKDLHLENEMHIQR